MVGHTHEDIDQLFSSASRYFKKLQHILTPQGFMRELRAAMKERPAHVEPVHTVVDWINLFKGCQNPGTTGIAHFYPRGNEGGEDLVPHTFHIHKREDVHVVLHYKHFAQAPPSTSLALQACMYAE